MTTLVTALLVSHDGDRWLAAVLDGLAAQTRQPDRCVAVDTASTDTGPLLLRQRLGADAVLEAPATSGFGEAVAHGLSGLPPAEEHEWVWLLHDDSAPAPDALERLLVVAGDQPSVSVLGPTLRAWPSLRRLLEVGVTISGTGGRETGLEHGEHDQGQHDRVRDVLAVNTAGMLVRRSLLESLGLDPRLPLFGNDIDLGWRAARAGERVVVVPDAVVFHVEAAHRGLRRTPVTGRVRRGERAAALYVLLVNAPPVTLPLRVVRLLLGSLLRALGLLLVRAPREALDELSGLASTYLRPGRVVAGRRARRGTAKVPHREVRHLLAPAWVPYRRGLDLVGDAVSRGAHQAGDRSAARRARHVEPAATETGPVPAEAQSLPDDPGVLGRLVAGPVAWTSALLVLAAVVAARDLVGHGTLQGGALLPAPDSALDWWRTYLGSEHRIGTGSSAPAAPYLLPMAVAGTVLVGRAWLLVDVLFLLAVPLAAWGAHRFLLRVTASRPASLWGAVAYGVLPVVTGAVQGGRLGTVVGTLVLPWLAHAALFLRAGESADRRARAAWRTALWLGVLAAFVPVAWAMAVLVGLVVLVAAGGDRTVMSRVVLTPLVAVLVLLLPWSLATWSHQGPAAALFEAGLPSPHLARALGRWDLVLGRPGAGAPLWLSTGVLLAALAALLRPDTRRAVLRAWTVVVVALATTAVLASSTFSTSSSTTDQPLWMGFPLVVAQAAGIAAAALAGSGIRSRLTGASFGWRQPVGALVVVLAVLTPLASVLWWASSGSAGALHRGSGSDVPTYMTDAALEAPVNGVLVLRGSTASGFRYVLLRQPGMRLGDDSVLPSAAAQSRLTAYVEDLAAAPTAAEVRALSRLGVAFVYAPAPADAALAAHLDSVSGLSRASATGRSDRAWQLDSPPSDEDLHLAADRSRPWLLLVQGLALGVAAVLAAPSRRRAA